MRGFSLKKINFLAVALHDCEDEVICDLAEVYHLYDYRGLSPKQVSALVFGLGDKSRTKRKLSGIKVDLDTLLLAQCVDALRVLVWQKTKDGHAGTNKPESIAAKLIGQTQEEEYMSFSTPEEFWEFCRNKEGKPCQRL